MSHSSVSAEDLNRPLGDQLYRRFIPSRFDDRCPLFLPEGCIERLVTERAIAAQLFGSDVTQPPETDLIRFVHAKAKKVFAIAVCCGFNSKDLLVTARFFQSIDFTDSHLPIANPRSDDPGSSAWNLPFPFDKMPESDIKQIWNGWKVDMFYERQWGFLAPVFSTTVFQHDVSPDCIFPFTWVNSIRKSGTFSHVYEVQIHPEHQTQPSSTVDGQPPHVAIKEIIVGDDDLRREIEKEYEDERKALSEITELQHNHIIQRIAAITRGERRYFMFQWADGGNLREFWKAQKQPSLTPELVTQTITQLLGLADALHALHNFKGQGNYRHGDLKPENILRFRDETIVGILKIADMGLAKHHPDATAMRKKATSAKYGTVRYEPPEVITSRLDTARSRLYDIWSMGCIMLECIIWLLYGYTELERFDESLSASGYDSSFFKIKDVDNARVAEVHPTVVEWMTSLATDPRCGTNSAIGDLLKLVRDRLLVVPLRTQASTWTIAVPQIATVTDTESSSATSASKSIPEIGPYRADAKAMRSGLERILERASSNKAYLSKGQERQYNHLPAVHSSTTTTQTTGFLPLPPDQRRGNIGALGVPQAQRANSHDYEHALSDHWRFSRDNDFARVFLKSIDNITHDLPHPRFQKLCQHCQRLDFLSTGFYLSDTVSDVRQRADRCGFCQLLLEACLKFEHSGAFQLHREGSNLRMSGKTEITKPILSIVCDPDSRSSRNDRAGLQIGFPKLATSGHILHFEVLRQWLRNCDQGPDHSSCRQPAKVDLPTRLINVSGGKIRLWETKGARGQYLALSHPWGDATRHHHFCTYPDNIEKHMKGIDFEDLPATFKDAVTTTRELGFHHLWIDSICIKQGSHGDFKAESKHMENVFSSAYCVIAASRATGQESGFLGPRPEREYTTFSQGNEGNYHICEQIDDFEGDVVQGNLNKRGWVLQERALAHRTIYFTERQTYWECGQGVRCETLTKLENNVAAFLGDPQFPTVAMNSPRGAKIHLYQDLYKQYSRLQFSRDEDRPFGIAGLEKRLIHSFKTQGGYGVLDDGEGLLRRSLLWQRGSASTLSRIMFPAERDMKVPTWSWMAYTGGIDYLEPPFDGVDWKTSEVQSPWTDQAPDGLHHTSDKSLGITLSAVVREFAQSSTDQSMSRLVLDNPTKSDGEVSNLRVVIVGKTWEGSGSSQRRCYVLIVAPNTSKHVAGSLVYERMGVGYMAESCISPTGTSGRIQ